MWTFLIRIHWKFSWTPLEMIEWTKWIFHTLLQKGVIKQVISFWSPLSHVSRQFFLSVVVWKSNSLYGMRHNFKLKFSKQWHQKQKVLFWTPPPPLIVWWSLVKSEQIGQDLTTNCHRKSNMLRASTTVSVNLRGKWVFMHIENTVP